MMIIENDLVINKSSAREIGAQGANLIKRLKRKGITHIVFLKGISSFRIETDHCCYFLDRTGDKVLSSYEDRSC